MLLAAAVLFLQFPVFTPHQIQPAEKVGEPAAVRTASSSAESETAPSSASSAGKVLTAEAMAADAAAPVAFAPGRLVPEPLAAAASAAADPAPVAAEPAAIVPVYGPIYGPNISAVSDRRQKREWLALSIAAHSAAGFDAWSTRRVLSSVPQAQEMNPFLRPFAGNASMYAAVQVLPTALDFLSRKMMHSEHAWARHTWWLPQAVSAVVSVSSGVHNVGVYNSR